MKGLLIEDAHLADAHPLTLAVGPGEHVALVGEVDDVGEALAGILTGRLSPTAGRISFDGLSPGGKARELREAVRPKLGIWRHYRRAPLNPRLPLLAAIEEPLIVGAPRMLPRARRDRVAEVLTGLGGDPNWLDLQAADLSPLAIQLGMLARALINEPAILLGIEPFAGLDPEETAPLVNLLLSKKDEGAFGLLLVNRDLGLAAHVAERILVFQGGACVEEGSARRIRLSPSHPYTRLLANSLPETWGGGFLTPARPLEAAAPVPMPKLN